VRRGETSFIDEQFEMCSRNLSLSSDKWRGKGTFPVQYLIITVIFEIGHYSLLGFLKIATPIGPTYVYFTNYNDHMNTP